MLQTDPEPLVVRLFIFSQAAAVVFMVCSAVMACRVSDHFRRSGSMGLGARARGFWGLGALVVFLLIGVHATFVVSYRRNVQLRAIERHEATFPGDRTPREELMRRMKIETAGLVVVMAAFFTNFMFWRRLPRTSREDAARSHPVEPL